MTIGIVSRLDVPRNRRGGLERIGPNSGPVKKSAKAPTPLKTPVQIVDPEDRPWRTQYRRTSLRLVQLTSRRLVLRGRFRLPTDFSHSVFITFGGPASPSENRELEAKHPYSTFVLCYYFRFHSFIFFLGAIQNFKGLE